MDEVIAIGIANFPLLLPALGYAVAWLVLRFFFYLGLRTYWRSLPAGKLIKDAGLQEKVLEESFAIIGSVVAFVLSFDALQHSDRGECGLRSVAGCFAGWPLSVGTCDAAIELFHTVELGWYLHYLIKHALGMGMVDNLQMHLHHAATISLLVISFVFNVYRSGVLVLFVLNISNPFLHMAKVLHYVEAPGDKVSFLLFAVAFFVSRIVIYPAVVLRSTLVESIRAQPGFMDPGRYLVLYVLANLLLLVLMAMQIIWFMGIVRLLLKAFTGSREDFKKEGKAHDYAKTKHD